MPLNFEPVPYEEAARIVAEKQIMSKEAFDALCDELKARAFVVSGLEDLRMAKEIRDAIAELPRGAAWEDVKAQVAEKLEAGGFSKAAADHRATLLLRHHGFAAYAQEQYRNLQEMKDVFPYWQYKTMGDEKVRSSHAALDGLILPADDPFWRDHYPPWEWNCRCQVVGVTEEQYNGAKTVGSFDATDPDEKAGGWKLTPALHERLRQGQLDDGSGHPVMVTRTGSLHFDPSGPGLDLAEIQKRYDPADWARFKSRMEAEKLADGRSVWDWATGKKAAQIAKTHAPAALPGETGRTATPRQDGDEAGEGEPLDVHVGMREAAREVWKGTQGPDGAEHLVAVDYRTGKKFGKTVKGTPDGVSARKLLEEARAKGTPIEMVHSHPSDCGVPSPDDVAVTLENADILKATGVVEWDRTFHTIRVGAEWWKRDEQWRNHWLEWLPRWQKTMPYPNWVAALDFLREEGVIEYEKNAPIGI